MYMHHAAFLVGNIISTAATKAPTIEESIESRQPEPNGNLKPSNGISQVESEVFAMPSPKPFGNGVSAWNSKPLISDDKSFYSRQPTPHTMNSSLRSSPNPASSIFSGSSSHRVSKKYQRRPGFAIVKKQVNIHRCSI